MLRNGMQFLTWQGQKIVGHCSYWRTVCFGEDVVQLLRRIVEAWLY